MNSFTRNVEQLAVNNLRTDQEIADILGVSKARVTNAIYRLKASGKVESTRVRRRMRVLYEIRQLHSLREVCQNLRLSEQTVRTYVHELIRDGLLKCDPWPKEGNEPSNVWLDLRYEPTRSFIKMRRMKYARHDVAKRLDLPIESVYQVENGLRELYGDVLLSAVE